jgi:hypothetical protein
MQHMVARILGLLLAALVMHHPSPASAQTAVDPLQYTLRFPEPHTHYVEVEAVVPTGGRPVVELMMAVWTPGSYMVREYSRHVEAVTASGGDGRGLEVAKSDKNRWRIATNGAPAVTVRYRVYAREMTVRTNWVDSDFAMLNGAPTFMTLADGVARPHEVTIEPARGWRVSMTGLPEMPGGPHRYRAPDYDTLVDSPIVVGDPAVHEFTVAGKKHYLVNVGEAGVFDGARAAKDVETIVAECLRMWGALPYDKYVFFNLLTLITPNRGELEALAGRRIGDLDELAAAARQLADSLGVAVLGKGGHAGGPESVDVLAWGERIERLRAPRVEGGEHVHGTGCALATAIASHLALGASLVEACRAGKALVGARIAAPVRPGRGAPAIV